MDNNGNHMRDEGITDSEHFSPYRADGKLVRRSLLFLWMWRNGEREERKKSWSAEANIYKYSTDSYA
jgi:hypothetical protein